MWPLACFAGALAPGLLEGGFELVGHGGVSEGLAVLLAGPKIQEPWP